MGVSNKVSVEIYEPKIYPTSDSTHTLERSSHTIESCIEPNRVSLKGSKRVLTRPAVNERKYNYFESNKGKITSGNYTAFLESCIDGKDKTLSNAVNIEIMEPEIAITIDENNTVHQALLCEFNEGLWNLGWVVTRNGEHALTTTAEYKTSKNTRIITDSFHTKRTKRKF